MKKKFIILIILIYQELVFSTDFIKYESLSYEYDTVPVSKVISHYSFYDNGIVKEYKKEITRGKEVTKYLYTFKIEKNCIYIHSITENDYISSEPNSECDYQLKETDKGYTILYENQEFGNLYFDQNNNQGYFFDYETNTNELFFEKNRNQCIIYLNDKETFILRNNVFYIQDDKETESDYNYNTENYVYEISFEGLKNKVSFQKHYICSNNENICLLWIMRYDIDKYILPYLLYKQDYSYYSTTYLTEESITYEPEHLQYKDGLPWASGNGEGIGEVISIKDFEHENPTVVKIINGYHDINHPDYYEKNSRVKKLKVTNNVTKKSKYLDIKDIKDEQVFSISDLGKGSEYSFKIEEVYEGKKYKDLCIQYLVVE